MTAKAAKDQSKIRLAEKESNVLLAYIREHLATWRMQKKPPNYQDIANEFNRKKLLGSGKRVNTCHVSYLFYKYKIAHPRQRRPGPDELAMAAAAPGALATPADSERDPFTSKQRGEARQTLIDLLLLVSRIMEVMCQELDMDAPGLSSLLGNTEKLAGLARWAAPPGQPARLD